MGQAPQVGVQANRNREALTLKIFYTVFYEPIPYADSQSKIANGAYLTRRTPETNSNAVRRLNAQAAIKPRRHVIRNWCNVGLLLVNEVP